jgi:Protein of unknown function (DUF5818)
MKTKWALSVFAVTGLALAPTFVTVTFAQEGDKDAKIRTLTGCITKPESGKEFQLTTADGSTWELHSKTVKLRPHLGHTVTVSGRVWQADMHGAKEKTKEAVDPDAKEHGHLSVTDVVMVSDSCKK